MAGYRPACPACGSSSGVDSASDAYHRGTGYETVTDWQTSMVPAGKNGELIPVRRLYNRAIVHQTRAARRLAPPEPPSGSAAAEPLGCSIGLVGGALFLTGGFVDWSSAAIMLAVIAGCLLWVLSGFDVDNRNRRGWRETGYPPRQRKLAVLERGWYCHHCDEVFL